MDSWKERVAHALNKVNAAYKKFETQVQKVKDHAVLDTVARMAMKAIPIVGPVIEEWYDKVGANEPDGVEKVQQFLKHFEKLNEEQFLYLSITMHQNRDEIVKSRTMIDDQLKQISGILKGEIQINHKLILDNKDLISKLLLKANVSQQSLDQILEIGKYNKIKIEQLEHKLDSVLKDNATIKAQLAKLLEVFGNPSAVKQTLVESAGGIQ